MDDFIVPDEEEPRPEAPVVYFNRNLSFGKTAYILIPMTNDSLDVLDALEDEDEEEEEEDYDSDDTDSSCKPKKQKTDKHVLAKIKENQKLVQAYNETDKDMTLDLRQQILLLDVNVQVKSGILNKYDTTMLSASSDSDRNKFLSWTKDLLRLPFNKTIPFPLTLDMGALRIREYLSDTKKVLDRSVAGHDNVKDEILDYIARMVSNPNGKGNILALCGDKGTGKCHGKGTLVRMADYSLKAVETIQVGDLLLGDDLTPRTVESVCTGQDQLYKVSQSNGLSFVANGVHPLCLKVPKLPSLMYNDVSSSFVFRYIDEEKSLPMRKDVPIHRVGQAQHLWKHIRETEGVVHIPIQEHLQMPSNISSQFKGYRVDLLHILWDKLVKVITPTDDLDTFTIDKASVATGYACGLVFLESTLVFKKGLSNAVEMNDYKIVDKSTVYSTVTISRLGMGEYFGFEISGNHRYLLHDGTVTHNTRLIKKGVAAALNRPFGAINMGGLTDSSILTGHSATYIGATFGRISEILISSKVNNPVIYLDELDKIQSQEKERGSDVYKVLLSLLDEEQSSEFHDDYFGGINLDLSKVLWVVSMNSTEKVDPILLDRLKVINIKALDTPRKVEIVSNYILPELMELVGMNMEDIIVPEDTIRHVIAKTDEPGCRQLKKKMETIVQKLNTQRITETGVYQDNHQGVITVTTALADSCLKSNELNRPDFSHIYT